MRIEDGRLLNPEYHNRRMERTIRGFYKIPGFEDAVDAEAMLKSFPMPEECLRGTVKCRLLYDFSETELEWRVEYSPYVKNKVETLKLVESSLDYRFKYTDRSGIDAIKKLRGTSDDILIVKNGLLTDASSANIVILKDEKWFTPAVPLLEGTARNRLIESGIIEPADITVDDLLSCDGVKLINAMLEFEQQPLIPISSVEGL